MSRYLEDVNKPNFTAVKITRKEDVWTAFKQMLAVETGKQMREKEEEADGLHA